jgi:microcompartment protein CcmK/EutM
MGKVIGTVVASQKDYRLEGLKLLIVEQVTPEIEDKGSTVVAVDSVGAGIGEVVLYSAGSSARLTDTTENKPVDTVIVAIVDSVEKEGKNTYQK